MNICRDCGQEIIFRYFDGVCVPMHLSGDCGRWSLDEESVKKAIHTKCPICGQKVWLVRHNGGTVWLDGLGLPWPKHPCFDKDCNGTKAVTPYTLADLKAYAKERRCHFCSAMVKPWLYRAHVVGVHKLSPAAIISAEAFEKNRVLRQEQDRT